MIWFLRIAFSFVFITMLVALPFMSDVLASHMARLAARIVGG